MACCMAHARQNMVKKSQRNNPLCVCEVGKSPRFSEGFLYPGKDGMPQMHVRGTQSFVAIYRDEWFILPAAAAPAVTLFVAPALPVL